MLKMLGFLMRATTGGTRQTKRRLVNGARFKSEISSSKTFRVRRVSFEFETFKLVAVEANPVQPNEPNVLG